MCSALCAVAVLLALGCAQAQPYTVFLNGNSNSAVLTTDKQLVTVSVSGKAVSILV